MRKTTERWQQKLRIGGAALHGRQRGQTLIIIVFAFIGILAFIGLGVDLANVYAERVKVSRAVDAAALAAAAELPLEDAAEGFALAYLQENGYDYTDTSTVRLIINEGTPDEVIAGASEANAMTTIWIDTAQYRKPPSYLEDSPDRIKVRVQREVFMMFMQFIGFSHFPVEATAMGENITSVDTVIVYDESGSMEFDTLCYGCWEPVAGQMYPDGTIYPLHWSDTTIASADHCASACGEGDYQNYDSTYEYNDCNYRHRTYTSRYWIVIEAEEYSELYSTSPNWGADYHRYAYTPGKTYWVMQHNGHGAYYRDGSIRGAYLTHHPYYVADYGKLGVSCVQSAVENDEVCKYGIGSGPFAAPRADYDFYAPQTGTYYFWIRGQGGQTSSDNHIFWGVDESSPPGSVGVRDGFDFYWDINYDGASSGDWEWLQLGSDWLSQGNHTLNLWAGGAGFDVDRIIITTRSGTPPSTIRGADPNNGRTNWACSPCDPRFAGRPGGQTSPAYRPDCNIDTRSDDIYDDEQPIRSALEAAKNFVVRLNPRFDQIGYVRYDDNVVIASELECLRHRGAEALDNPACNPDWSNPGGEPPRDPDCGCFAGVITNTVLYELDRTHAGGSTNIGGGIKQGIEVLSTGGGHYGRPGAAHIMVLMTDGQPTARPSSDPCDDDPNLWPEGDGDQDCVIYYANEARNNAIVIYTISLGWSADLELMKEVADITGGEHFFAPSPDKLDPIFDALFERIFLRLVY